MLRELQLERFKAFEHFTLNLDGDAYLIGPNNAGKSTLVGAIRSTARMLRQAQSKKAGDARRDGSRVLRSLPLNSERLGILDENIRHEFRPDETRIRAKFDGGGMVTAVWPAAADHLNDDGEDAAAPFFYLELEGARHQPTSPVNVRGSFPIVGVIPALTPVEQREDLKDRQYVGVQAETRLVSRHFRNHLHVLQEDGRLQEFLAFAAPWVPELELLGLEMRDVPGSGRQIDFYFLDAGRRAQKEISWAGDGMQVWLQLLLHVFRLQDADVLVLDEPDLYLHADLQRRLVRVLDSVPAQTITATHSPEMIGEALPETVVWVDKTRRRAVRNPSPATLADISTTMGTQFNLRLAKALRSRTVVFVEGRDMQIISTLARTLGLNRVANESMIAVVPLGGFSNWEHVEPFKWLVEEFLEDSVQAFVILDRDYRGSDAVREVVGRLADVGVTGHVWRRKELESYVLEVPAIARTAGCSEVDAAAFLESATQELRLKAYSRGMAEALRTEPSPGSVGSSTEKFEEDFQAMWSTPSGRLSLVPAAELISRLNARLAAASLSTIDAKRLAKALHRSEIDPEVAEVLAQVERG